MGLDMYLNKKTYVMNWNHMEPEELHEITVKKGGEVSKHIKPERVSVIEEQVGYWRKVNSVHKWFVDNVQHGEDNCKEYPVALSQLVELQKICKKVLRKHSLAEELLPNQSGFFFGSADYDEYYFRDLKDTVKIIDDLLAEKRPDSNYLEGDLYYQSSW